MVYPVLPPNKATALINEIGLSPYFDIVWSFDYFLENIQPNTEFGFLFFLQDAEIPISGGNFGIDLGYSGLSADNNGSYSSFLSAGLQGGVIGVGFDSTGSFALSTSNNNLPVRDGKSENDVIPNSLTVRSSSPLYSYDEYSINIPISSFSIIDSVRKTIRARLGNLGRTLYIDWRRTPKEQFINIFEQDVTLNISLSTLLRPGITVSKPISSSQESAVPTVIIENFHAEGDISTPNIDAGGLFNLPSLSGVYYTLSCIESNLCLYECTVQDTITACALITCNPFATCDEEEDDDIITPPTKIVLTPSNNQIKETKCTQVDIVSGFVYGIKDSVQTVDIFNYGYALSGTGIEDILYRTNYFEYKTLNGSIILTQLRSESGEFATRWILSGVSINSLEGGYSEPVGTFSNSLTTVNIDYL